VERNGFLRRTMMRPIACGTIEEMHTMLVLSGADLDVVAGQQMFGES
jgi:hypothetical protein